MKARLLPLCLLSLVALAIAARELRAASTHEGTEFWLAMPNNCGTTEHARLLITPAPTSPG